MKYLSLLLLFRALVASAQTAVTIADFGLEDDYTWANKTDNNYGFGVREDTATTFTAVVSGYAQANWALLEVIDLSEHTSVPMTILGNLENATGEAFRIFIYDNLGNLAAVEFTEGFSGGTRITEDQWNKAAWDAFGGKGTGTLDWSTVSKVGFRTNSGGPVTFEIDKLVLGEVEIPDGGDGGGTGGGGTGEPADPLPEPWTFIPPNPLEGPTLLEKVHVTEEISVIDHPLNACDWASPTASHNGVIYYAYIDPDQEISVVAKYPDGTMESSKVIPNVYDDNHHVEPSLGIDADGYLHLVGNMHNDPMQYYRTLQPMDISEWESLGNNPEGGIDSYSVTYPSFFNAPDGTLFIAFRDRMNDSYGNGMLFGSVGRYDLETRSWTMLGNPVTELNSPKVGQALIWGNYGGAFGYQGYKIRCAFSPSGRLHVSWNISKDPANPDISLASGQHTHVMYAYSDDKGDTWFQADGTMVTPPLGAQNVEPVFDSETDRLYNNTAIAFTSDDRGIVGQYDHYTEQMLWFIWDGNQWVEFDNKADVIPGILAPGPYGSLNAFSQDAIHRSWDNGETWKQYKLPGTYISGYESFVDLTYFRKTGKLRFSANGGNGTVTTLEFSSTPVPVGGPLTIATFDLPTAAFGRLYGQSISVGGGDGSYTFSITEGSLPIGLTLNSAGLLTGVPAETGSFPVTIQVEDGSMASDAIQLTLVVAAYRDLPIRDISSNDYSDSNPPEFAADGEQSTRWTTTTKGNWLLLDLGEPQVADEIAINWAGSSGRSYHFRVEVSNDKENWTLAFEGSSELNSETQSYPLSVIEPIRYFRVTGNGSTFDDRTNINEISIRQSAMEHVTPWPNAIHHADNWKSTWLGWLQDDNYPYVYHLEHGWLYAQSTGTESAWFYGYQDNLGWFHTSSSIYSVPQSSFLFHAGLGWLYYYPGTRPGWFHSYVTGEDFQLPLP